MHQIVFGVRPFRKPKAAREHAKQDARDSDEMNTRRR